MIVQSLLLFAIGAAALKIHTNQPDSLYSVTNISSGEAHTLIQAASLQARSAEFDLAAPANPNPNVITCQGYGLEATGTNNAFNRLEAACGTGHSIECEWARGTSPSHGWPVGWIDSSIGASVWCLVGTWA
jgi:hypothetical protein